MAIFVKKKKETTGPAQPAPGSQKEATYFGKNLKITGNVSGDGDLIILGSLEGEFDLKGKLQVAEPAHIIGTVKANEINVKGNIQGNITALEKIHLDPTARINGQITTPKLSVTEGASFNGEVKMSSRSHPAPSPTRADTRSKPIGSSMPGKKE
jgi:cytoskeletal protein CcmA (bactofilin family)